MAQPVWITPAGSLGIIPEGLFYQQDMLAYPAITGTAVINTAVIVNVTDFDNIEVGDQLYSTLFPTFTFVTAISTTNKTITVDQQALNDAVATDIAYIGGQILYSVISGLLPQGIQLTNAGIITGVSFASASQQGVPLPVNRNVTSKFAIRAYTTKVVNGQTVVARLRDRTFELTISGNDVPDFVTPAGSIGTFYDGDEVDIQIQFTDVDPDETIAVTLLDGELPLGLTLTRLGRISGYIAPAPNVDEPPGYDLEPISVLPFDFVVSAINKNYQFTLEVSDGKSSSIRTFTIFVYDRAELTADTTEILSDTTEVDASQTTERAPFLTNAEPTSIGRVRSDNYFAYQFLGDDYDTADIEYLITVNEGLGLPPGLTLDATSGWLYGYIPDQGITEITYSFFIQVRQVDNPLITSQLYPFTLTIIAIDDDAAFWVTDADLGTVENGSTSLLYVEAQARNGAVLNYRLKSGAANQLPQGLELLPTGELAGRITFNTFALDLGFTTFDIDLGVTTGIDPTTFDSKFTFTINAFAPGSNQALYKVTGITVISGGSGYNSATPPTIVFSDPAGSTAVAAVAGAAVISAGVIVSVPVVNAGSGYLSAPTVTITAGFGGSGAVLEAQIQQVASIDSISVFKTFTVTVDREYNYPYQNLFCLALPPANDRILLNQLLTNQEIFVPSFIYRPQDANFGVSTRVKYEHAYGLAPESVDTYVSSLYTSHYWKNLILGGINTAQALDVNGNVVYEVVYSKIIDDLVNNAGQSVNRIVNLGYPIIDPADGSTVLTQVYPNSLKNMRDQVIDVVGQISTKLPLWMTSKQTNGRVLGFTPAWVICYAEPGRSAQIAYYIQEYFAQNLNTVDFKVDRYVLDRTLSKNWDTETQTWTPQGTLTTFDFQNTTGFENLGLVQCATNLAYSDINYRTIGEINANGGIDGLTAISSPGVDPPPGTRVLVTSGTKIVFVKQQDYGNYATSDDAWQDYIIQYDTVGFDAAGTTFDEAVTIPGGENLVCSATVASTDRITISSTVDMDPGDVIWFTGDVFGGVINFNNDNQVYYILDVPSATEFRITATQDGTTPVALSNAAGSMNAIWGNYRMGIWEITVVPGATATEPETLELSLIQQTSPNQFLQVTQGQFYNTAQLYRPTVPGPALTAINWQPFITAVVSVSSETTFDEASMQFIAPVDMYTTSDALDKYLVFPKTNILV